MNGYIKTYFEKKNFGFIATNDEQTYFFHDSDIQNKKSISIGTLVSFTPDTTSNGLKAKNISVNIKSDFIKTFHDEFIENENDINGLLKIDYSCPPLSAQGDTPEEAKEILFKLIKSIGANGTKNVKYFKTKGSTGNYIYTIHNYSGEPSLIFKNTPSDDRSSIDRSKILQNKIITSFEENYKELIKSNEIITEQNKIGLDDSSRRFLFFMAILFCVIMIIYQII